MMRNRITHVSLKLPPVETPDDLLKAMGAVLRELAEGKLRPDEAATIAGILESHRRAVETVDIERRLADLERMNAQN